MPLKTLTFLFIATCIFSEARSQVDSTALELENLTLNSKFSQFIMVSGEELERLPFRSLSEAVSVYFNGAYTNDRVAVYVIDGNIGADINAYSVHDIESVTLIQDGRAIINGAPNEKQLLLVKTRTGVTRKTELVINASTYLVRNNQHADASQRIIEKATFFHQLYLGGRYAKNKLEIGGSSVYLHDAFSVPVAGYITHASPSRFNRLSANGWMNLEIGRSQLTLR